MKVGLFSDTYYPEINGVATSTQQLKNGLETMGHEVYVFAPKNKNYEEEKNVIRKYSIPFILLKDRRVCFFRARKAAKEIQKLNLDVVHSQTEFMMGHLARLTARRYNLPHVHTYHTVYEDYTHYLKIPGKNSNFIKSIVRKLSKIMCERADYIVVPTDKVKKLLESYDVKKPILVQPTGVSYDKFSAPDSEKVEQLKKQYGINTKSKVLISVGRMSKEKNMAETIKYLPSIIKKHSDVMLVIVGDGPERERLTELAKKYNVTEHIVFTGCVPWSEMQNYYALGDIFVCASTSETQGLTYIEALASGKPLLVRYDDCLENVLYNGENGCGYTDENEFVDGYESICQNYERMQQNGIKVAMYYSNLTFAENMLALYKKLTK